MTKILRSRLLAIGLCAFAVPFAHADNCTKLANKTQCFTFKYSTGGSNSYTATFGADGSTFSLGGNSTGTYTCAGGLGLVDVEYFYGGFEQQSWYGKAGKQGNSMTGNGKSISNGYMYSFTSVPGACAADAAPQVSARQDL
jgi:hypothetical protein